MDWLRKAKGAGGVKSSTASSVEADHHLKDSAATTTAPDSTETTIVGPDVPVAGVDRDVKEKTADGAAGNKVVAADGSVSNGDAHKDASLPEASTGESGDAEKQGEAGEEEVEDTSNYPKGWQLAILTFGLAMAIFVVSITRIYGPFRGRMLTFIPGCLG